MSAERTVTVITPPSDTPFPGPLRFVRFATGHYALQDCTGWTIGLFVPTTPDQERLAATVEQINDDLRACAAIRVAYGYRPRPAPRGDAPEARR
jgi:hypothetical protein